MSNVTNNGQNPEMGIHSVPGKCETDLTNKAEAVGAACSDRAKGAAPSVAHTDQGVSFTLREKANEATAAVGSGMKSLAGTIREHTPSEGGLHTASSSLAQSLETGGRYLQEEALGAWTKHPTN